MYLTSRTDEGTVSESQNQIASRRGTRPILPRAPLSAADWWLLAGVALMQIAVAAGARIIPLRGLRRTATGIGRIIVAATRPTDARAIWAIEATGRRFGRLSTCLVRALVAEALLNSPERPVSLTIGVKRADDGSLRAHAWVATENLVLMGATPEDYVPLIEWKGTSA